MSKYPKSVVATGHELVSTAAAEILRQDGNAFDAAVAAGFAGAVAEQTLTSLGGGGFMLARTSGADLPGPVTPGVVGTSPGRTLVFCFGLAPPVCVFPNHLNKFIAMLFLHNGRVDHCRLVILYVGPDPLPMDRTRIVNIKI